MRSFGKFLLSCACCLSLSAAVFASVTNVSNAVTVKGWKREHLTFDTESNRFSRAEFPTLAEAEAAAELAEELPGLYVAATNALMTNLAPVYVATTNHKAKTVVALTGAASLDNLLDRQNLTMAVVSNEVTRNANGTRSVRAWVAENFVTKSPPVMQARLRTISGEDEWIEAEWADGWTNATTITLIHPQSYTNFVVATVTNEATVVLTTNVVFSVIEDAYRQVVTTNRLEYDCVEYLQGSGAYIDTGLIIDDDLEFSIDAQVTADGTSFGGNVASGSDYYRFTFGYRSNVRTGTYYSFFGGSSDNYGYSSNAFAIQRHLFEYRDSAFYIDNTKIANKGSHYLSNDYGVTYTLYGCNSKDGVSLMGGSIVWSAVFRKAEERYHFIPVLHEGEGKMLDLVHNTLYANAGTGAFTYGAVTSTVTYVTLSTNYVHYCVTNSETRAITLTNQVIVVTDGTIPRIVTAGDREELQCHPLDYTIPATAVPPDLSRWVRIGHPDTGFNFGNRALRVNGVTTLTTNDLNFLGDFMVYTNGVPVSVTNDFTFFADNGLLKVAERSTNTVSGVNL